MTEKLSEVMIEFVRRQEADGVDEVSQELVRLRWIPEVAALEAELEMMTRAVRDALDEMGDNREAILERALAAADPANPKLVSYDVDGFTIDMSGDVHPPE
jgi:hypothetical protein